MRSIVWLALALVLASGSAHAGRARWQYDGDACSGDVLEGRVIALAGRDPFADDARSTIVVRVQREADHVAASVWKIDERGEERGRRTLTARSCDQLEQSLALVVAMTLDAPDPPVPPPPKAARVATRTEATSAVPSSPTMRGAVLAGVQADDHLHSAAVVGGSLQRGRASLALELSIARTETLAVGTGDVSIVERDISVVPCVHAGVVAACAVATAGWVEGRAHGLVAAHSATTPFGAAGVRAAVELGPWGRFALRAEVEGRVSLTKDRFFVDQMTVWAAPRFEALAGLAVIARVP